MFQSSRNARNVGSGHDDCRRYLEPSTAQEEVNCRPEKEILRSSVFCGFESQLCSSFAFESVVRNFTLQSQLISDNKSKQEGNVLQEPAAAMILMFLLKGLYNVAMKSVSRKEMFPKFYIFWPLSKITIRCPRYPNSI